MYFFQVLTPHAGEQGILGVEDEEITKAISLLKGEYPHINFKGPLPGDTLHFEDLCPQETLQVYAFHDQGLVRFKSDNGTIWIKYQSRPTIS
jgi:4-hydroxy-L-threonine phosphate dehydrogenase PdxA